MLVGNPASVEQCSETRRNGPRVTSSTRLSLSTSTAPFPKKNTPRTDNSQAQTRQLERRQAIHASRLSQSEVPPPTTEPAPISQRRCEFGAVAGRVNKDGPSPGDGKGALLRQEAGPDHQAFDSVDRAVRTMQSGGSLPQAELVTSFHEGSAGMIGGRSRSGW